MSRKRSPLNPGHFHTKLCNAAKEAREAHDWLRLIRDRFPTAAPKVSELLILADELVSILTANTRKTKNS